MNALEARKFLASLDLEKHLRRSRNLLVLAQNWQKQINHWKKVNYSIGNLYQAYLIREALIAIAGLTLSLDPAQVCDEADDWPIVAEISEFETCSLGILL